MGLLTPVAIRIGAISWMPRFLPQITWLDKLIQRVTRGRLSLLGIAGIPNLMLTVIGRKSGIARETPLLCVPYGEDILIAGSYFGSPKEPIWVKNIEANPDVTVRFRRRTMPMVARHLEGDERAAAWSHMLETWPNFARYEQRTDRHIKVFLLTPTFPVPHTAVRIIGAGSCASASARAGSASRRRRTSGRPAAP